ncbi:hypothetical protein ACFWMU_25050 [Streptomyces sp. NPDC058357]|uniref:hypothetical protein n=1 Tax=unclassified Streptomyces TaxID=2593676 RepID=UPI00365D8CF9
MNLTIRISRDGGKTFGIQETYRTGKTKLPPFFGDFRVAAVQVPRLQGEALEVMWHRENWSGPPWR